MTTLTAPAPVLGAQSPRVEHVPSYASSAGAEAVDLAASAGLVLDPWQSRVLAGALGEKYDVARQQSVWSAFEVGLIVPRQNGKGSILEARELAGLFLLGERLILHSAHELKTAIEAYLRIKALIQETPELDRMVAHFYQSNEKTSIELKNGQRLRFVARSSGSGRGFTGDCIILDEAYNLPQRAMAALMPTLSARPNPQLWYTSSAGMEESEVLSTVRKRGTDAAKGQDERASRLAYFEWSAADDADLDDVGAWAQANPGLGIRIQPEFVEAEREALGEDEFARERLGIWADARRQNLAEELGWHALRDRESDIGAQLAFALHVSPDRKWCSIVSAAPTTDGKRVRVEIVDSKRGTDWAASRLAELATKWKPVATVLRTSGPAGALLPDLQREGVTVDKLNETEYAQACGFAYDAARSGRLAHVGQPQLNVAVERSRKRSRGDVFVWHPRDGSSDISPWEAATMAAYGLSVFGNRVPTKRAAPMYGF